VHVSSEALVTGTSHPRVSLYPAPPRSWDYWCSLAHSCLKTATFSALFQYHPSHHIVVNGVPIFLSLRTEERQRFVLVWHLADQGRVTVTQNKEVLLSGAYVLQENF